MTLTQVSDELWDIAHSLRTVRDRIRMAEERANLAGNLPADLAGLLAHHRRVATAIENRREGDSPALDAISEQG